MKGILGKKLGMTQIFADDEAIPVTVVEAGPCFVTQIRTNKSDGYDAVQIGYQQVKEKQVNKPKKGHFSKAGVKPLKYLAELQVDKGEEYKVGQKITADIYAEGEMVDVAGVTKGKGFTGVVKRWGFSGGPASHGSHFHRAMGAIGACATPSRVFRGKKMPGRMGTGRVTIQNLEVVRVDADENLILVRGSIPGAKGSLVMMKTTIKPVKFKKRKKPAEPPSESHKRKAKEEEKEKGTEEEPREKVKEQPEQKAEKQVSEQQASAGKDKKGTAKDQATDAKTEAKKTGKEAKQSEKEG